MDDKTWQQVNLGGSTVIPVRGHHQVGEAENLVSSTSLGSLYPAGTVPASTNLHHHHWQRMTCCNRFNAIANSLSFLPSQHQQQFSQIQQQVPLRYFQIRKATTNSLQYGSNQISSASLAGHHHQQQQQQQHHHHHHHLGNPSTNQHQQHFAHLYTVLAPSSVSSNDSTTISEKTTCYGGGQENNSIVTYAQNRCLQQSLRTCLEDTEILNNHYNRNSKIQPNSISIVDKSIPILRNGNFFIPKTSETATAASPFSIPSDHVIPHQTRITNKLSRFVNAIEAVPDMLREVRPGGSSTASLFFRKNNTSNFSFLIDHHQAEFSYHAIGKPELTTIETNVASMEIIKQSAEENWPELSLKNHNRSYASIIDRKIILASDFTRIEDNNKTYCSVAGEACCTFTSKQDILMKPESTADDHCHRDEEKSRKYHQDPMRYAEIKTLQKTYADAVQLMMNVGGMNATSSRHHAEISSSPSAAPAAATPSITDHQIRTNNYRRIKLLAKDSPTICLTNVPDATPTFSETMSSVEKMTGPHQCMSKKREYQSSCCDDDNTTTLIVSNENKEKKEHDDDDVGCSWRRVEILNNDEMSSATSPRAALIHYERSRSPSRKHQRMCKMAEMFCLEQLEDPTFFHDCFDDHNRRGRCRMSYTRKFEAKSPAVMSTLMSQQNNINDETLNSKIHGEAVTLIAGLMSLERKGDADGAFFHCNDLSTKFRGDVVCSNSDPPVCQFRSLNPGMMDSGGVFKVLQKLKECADGTGALYTNSWRPGEIHFLRRCHRDKMPV